MYIKNKQTDWIFKIASSNLLAEGDRILINKTIWLQARSQRGWTNIKPLNDDDNNGELKAGSVITFTGDFYKDVMVFAFFDQSFPEFFPEEIEKFLKDGTMTLFKKQTSKEL